MEDVLKTLVLIFLFFVLSPGVFVSIPSKGGIKTIAFVHALVFGVIYYLLFEVLDVLTEGFKHRDPPRLPGFGPHRLPQRRPPPPPPRRPPPPPPAKKAAAPVKKAVASVQKAPAKLSQADQQKLDAMLKKNNNVMNDSMMRVFKR